MYIAWRIITTKQVWHIINTINIQTLSIIIWKDLFVHQINGKMGSIMASLEKQIYNRVEGNAMDPLGSEMASLSETLIKRRPPALGLSKYPNWAPEGLGLQLQEHFGRFR